MRQHSIDLMPADVRQRAQAGVRTGRFVALGAFVLVLTVVASTHSRLRLRNLQEQWDQISSRAAQVQTVEQLADMQQQRLEATQRFIDTYERVALPLNISNVIATVINALPESVTLEQFDLDANLRVSGRSPRSKGVASPLASDQSPTRMLTAEISGFAASDEDVAELVARLDAQPPFKDVGLDFSKTREVRGKMAREFRLSFRIDLGVTYISQPPVRVSLWQPSSDAAQEETRVP